MNQQFEESQAHNLPQILESLQKRDKEEQRLAELSLNELGPEAIEEMLAVVTEEVKQRKRRQHLALGILFGYMFLCIVLSAITHSTTMLTVMGSMSGVMAIAAASKKQKKVTEALAKFDDKRIVGPLIEALEFQDKRAVPVIEEALIRILPTLKASDAIVLKPEQRKGLYRALKRKNAQLVLAILKALEQMGDREAIPPVERLAQGEGRAARNMDIQKAAMECLPYLKELAQQEEARQTLLRAADHTSADPASLLRPASGVPDTDPQQLLRADTQA